MSNSIRLKTTPGGDNKNINVSINQDFDFIEILSLKISQDEAYRRFSSDYGCVVGRVIINNGVGVPNAKVSIFVPVEEIDKLDPEIFGLYPYETISDKNSDGMPYSLLPSNTNGGDECAVTVGRFDTKRQIQDNPESEEIYCKYYKFTTTTNNSGDYMIFGAPIGAHNVHVEVDLSDMGVLSQKPYNMINEGSSPNLFKSPNQFKGTKENIAPIQNKKVSPVAVNVIPFWGDKEQFEVGITRLDVDLLMNITPTAIFMGSVFTDTEKNSLNKKCRPRKKLGKMGELITGPGTIEMIRKASDGAVEFLDVDGGQLIDENGTWCYQVPMNLDLMVTSEKGDLVKSLDGKSGIPTRADVRFRVGMEVNGNEGRVRTRAKYLIPNNPTSYADSDYSFDTTTQAQSFKTLHWNKIYTVKNYIARVQPNKSVENRNFIGIKNCDDEQGNSPFPFNRMDSKGNPLFSILMAVIGTLAFLCWFINISILLVLNTILMGIQQLVWGIQKAVCLLKHPLSPKKVRQCRCCKLIELTDGLQGNQSCCNNKNNCSSGACKKYKPQAVIPYIKLSCDGEKYFLWNIGTSPEAHAKTCLDLENFAGQQIDCLYSEPTNTNKSISVGKYLECNAILLADALNVFKFDFYNDWINGTLYLFLLKFKYKRNGKQKFCDVDCDDDVLGDSNGDNKADNNCKKNYILDTATKPEPQEQNQNSVGNINMINSKQHDEIEEGYIKRGTDGTLYYSAISKRTDKLIFATDIINLGSINERDWQGSPQIYKSLIDTTFKIPPTVDENDEDNPSQINVSGFNGANDLIFTFSINAFLQVTVKSNDRQCNNIRRICELGIGLDEDRTDSGPNPVDLGEADGKIANNDVENPFIRGLFTYVNSTNFPQNINSSISLVYIDSSNNIETSNGFSNYKDPFYEPFRGSENWANYSGVYQFKNSYYFYFGLVPGKSALVKLIREYLTPCSIEVDNSFQCVTNTIIPDGDEDEPTGSIIADVIGGVPPLTYTWTGPEINGINYPQSGNIINNDSSSEIIELYSGGYELTVSDDAGNITSCAFQVGGPAGVSCSVDFDEPSISGGDDGSIDLNITDGLPPYSCTLTRIDPSTQQPTGNPSTQQINTSSTTFDDLESGFYLLEVSDSSTVVSTCSQYITLTEPSLPEVILTGSSISCLGGDDGQLQAIIADSNGGSPTKEWGFHSTSPSGPFSWPPNNSQIYNFTNGQNQTPTVINNVDESGYYKITYTDDLNQTDSDIYQVTEPSTSPYIKFVKPNSYDLVYWYLAQAPTNNSGPIINTLSIGTPNIEGGYSGVYVEWPYNPATPTVYSYEHIELVPYTETGELVDSYTGVEGGDTGSGDVPGYIFHFKVDGGTPPYTVVVEDVNLATSTVTEIEEWTNVQPNTEYSSRDNFTFHHYIYGHAGLSNLRSFRFRVTDANGCSSNLRQNSSYALTTSGINYVNLGNPGDTTNNACKWHSAPSTATGTIVTDVNGGTYYIWILNC